MVRSSGKMDSSDAHAVRGAWVVALSEAILGSSGCGSQGERNDETIEAHDTSEDEAENHPDKELGLVAHCAHPPVTTDGSGPARRDARESTRESSAQVHVAPAVVGG